MDSEPIEYDTHFIEKKIRPYLRNVFKDLLLRTETSLR
jgi:hypothetical protein